LGSRCGTDKRIDTPTVQVGDKSAALSVSLTTTESMRLVFTHIFLRSASGSGSDSSGRFSSGLGFIGPDPDSDKSSLSAVAALPLSQLVPVDPLTWKR
jgi:hypothetical protein